MATAAGARTAGNALTLLLGAAVFLNYVDRGAVGIAAPLMQSDLKLSATAFGLVASAFFWVYGPVQLVVGWLVDRFSVYRLMSWGLLVWAAATLLMGFAGGFLSLLVLRVLLGVGESIAFPGTSKIIAERGAGRAPRLRQRCNIRRHSPRPRRRYACRWADPGQLRMAGYLHPVRRADAALAIPMARGDARS